MSKHRADVRPRYGRIVVLGAAVMVTLVAVLGGSGLLPAALSGEDGRVAIARDPRPAAAAATADSTADAAATSTSPTSSAAPSASTTQPSAPATSKPEMAPARKTDGSLPADSGSGRRVVYSESRQRVWLVDDADRVRRTYLVSGSLYDNLEPGTYTVYSRSENAVGIDDSGTMKYFVRFTQGPSGAAIGFHTIPVDEGRPVQSVAQLGTPLSHGCVRQRLEDALALWDFAPIGTTVVVTP